MNVFGGRMRDEPLFHCEMQGAWVDPYIFFDANWKICITIDIRRP